MSQTLFYCYEETKWPSQVFFFYKRMHLTRMWEGLAYSFTGLVSSMEGSTAAYTGRSCAGKAVASLSWRGLAVLHGCDGWTLERGRHSPRSSVQGLLLAAAAPSCVSLLYSSFFWHVTGQRPFLPIVCFDWFLDISPHYSADSLQNQYEDILSWINV